MTDKLSEMLGNDSMFGQIFGKAGDIIITNLLFVLFSLPLITVGASYGAMMHTFLELRKGTDGPIAVIFWTGFRKQIKEAVGGMALLLGGAYVLAVDLRIFGTQGPIASMPLRMLCIAMLFMLLMIGIWLFPLMASYQASLKQHLIHAVCFAVRYLPYTFLMTAILLMAYMITVMNIQTLMLGISLWIFFGFGVIGAVYSRLMTKCLQKAGVDLEDR